MKRKNLLSIGIDLGGTKIATGLVNSAGRILDEDRRPSKAENHSELGAKAQIKFLIEAMADATLEIIQNRAGKTLKQKLVGIKGVGLGSAGPMDIERGVLIDPPNLGDWGTVPIVKMLTAALIKRGIPLHVYFQNDAIAAALGEGWVGVAKGANTYAMITLGTGLGTGVIFNGQPAQNRGMGSEWGHSVVNMQGMLEGNPYHATGEGLCTGTGMLRFAHSRGFKGASMHELADAARAGDGLALEVFAQASQALAAIFVNLSMGFAMDKFAVTGGLLPIKELFLPRAIDIYKSVMKEIAPKFEAPIVISKMGNKAGVVGAARLPFLS